MTMSAATPVPISEAKTHLSDLARRVRLQHERITLTRNGEPEAVLVSVDDLEGLEMTLEILGDSAAAARITESLAALERGERGVDIATVRADLARRRHSGS
jgi:antitoxin YefM